MQNKHTLEDIIARCECSVSLEVDGYKDNYLTFEEGLSDVIENYGVTEDVVEEMHNTGRIMRLQAYPNTPVGFEYVYGGTVQSVIDRMYALLTESSDV
jgi:hypothetical protein